VPPADLGGASGPGTPPRAAGKSEAIAEGPPYCGAGACPQQSLAGPIRLAIAIADVAANLTVFPSVRTVDFAGNGWFVCAGRSGRTVSATCIDSTD